MTISKDIVFEPYSPKHIDELVPMWRSSFEKAVGVKDPNPLAEQRQYFLDQVLPRNEVLVAVSGNVVVGFIAVTTDSVTQLYVDKEYQGRGIGTALLDWAMENSKGRLWLYTFEQNLSAQRFYERRGFKIIARGFETHWKLPDIKYEWVAPEKP